jgi:hypothetical protein
MAKAHPKPVWRFSRGNEPICVLSNQELLFLAELGHLRADDLLWRPDFDDWRTVRSLLGHASPLPHSISLRERAKQIGAWATTLLSDIKRIEFDTRGHPQNLGLLVAMVLLGVLGIATHGSFAIDTRPALQCTASTELQSGVTAEPQQFSVTTAAEKPSESTGVIVRRVRVFNIEPSDPSVLVADPASEGRSSSEN